MREPGGQYKNARAKEGFTKAKQKAFDLRNPKSQVFTKEDLAKYLNAYAELYDGKKLVIGPHWVVKGNQKNYAQFVGFNIEKKVDSIYFEDIIAKGILFKTAEKVYGVKPNAIGDMRYITVPYTISYFGLKTNYKLDLYKIWRNQAVSEHLKELLFSLMKQIESFIKAKAPGALYGEWAKKEECWNEVKVQRFDIDLSKIKADLEDPKSPVQRKRIADEESLNNKIQEELDKVRSIPPEVWHTIEKWGRATGELSEQEKTVAFNMAGRVRNNTKVSDYERQTAIAILDEVIKKAPKLLDDVDSLNEKSKAAFTKPDISIELIEKIVQWDKKNKKLRDADFIFMTALVKGSKPLTEKNKLTALANLEKVKKQGFNS